MKQYKITSDNIVPNEGNECYLAPEDPVHELKIAHYLGGLGSDTRIQEYRATNYEKSKVNTTSLTGTDKALLMKEQNIKPGTEEWFKLWFGK